MHDYLYKVVESESKPIAIAIIDIWIEISQCFTTETAAGLVYLMPFWLISFATDTQAMSL